MRFPSPLLPGTLLARYKRFFADVRLADDRLVTAHCPNSGSLLGCKAAGSPVYLSHHPDPRRRLPYTWEMIRVGRTWVGINTLWPNRLVVEAIEDGTLGELQGYSGIRREVRVSPRSRLDLCLKGQAGRCWVEVKNVTFRAGSAAAFPDAVTERGTRHLRELIRLVRAGHSAALVFVVQRGDCAAFRPADEVDPEYGRWLRRAVDAGVEVLPYQARVTPLGISLTRRLELVL
ncbi:MAG: DNA/RNA nuclease SfsA [Candidatus Rokubacteria bacterium]|nr:DNA/RNA nuclease SfsA [Candidatus Rokubacteria bacterium]